MLLSPISDLISAGTRLFVGSAAIADSQKFQEILNSKVPGKGNKEQGEQASLLDSLKRSLEQYLRENGIETSSPIKLELDELGRLRTVNKHIQGEEIDQLLAARPEFSDAYLKFSGESPTGFEISREKRDPFNGILPVSRNRI